MGPKTELEHTVRQKCDTTTILEAIGALYEGGKRTFASFAPLAFEAYRRGDEAARLILDFNTAKIAELILIAGRELPFDTVHKVMLVGGLTAHRDILIPLIQKHLPQQDRYALSVLESPVVHGALHLAGLKQIV